MSLPDYQITDAVQADAGEILALQRAAYRREALLYGDPRLPPLVQTMEELREELRRSTCLKAVSDHRIVGSVRGRIDGDTGHIGRLIVAPDMQRRGIGSRLMAELEWRLGREAVRFELFTGAGSIGNLRLYDRLGYREIRRQALNPRIELVFLEKRPAQRAST